MGVRSTESIVTFRRPFFLTSLGVTQPAGNYRLVVDETEIEGLSFVAYRRIATMLHVPALEISASAQQVYQIDPDELEAVSANDRLSPPETHTTESTS